MNDGMSGHYQFERDSQPLCWSLRYIGMTDSGTGPVAFISKVDLPNTKNWLLSRYNLSENDIIVEDLIAGGPAKQHISYHGHKVRIVFQSEADEAAFMVRV